MPWDDLRRGRFSEAGRAYLVTTVVAGRRPVFRNLGPGRVLVREMMTLQGEAAVSSLAYVVMPDHLHWLLVLQDRWTLSEVMRRLKGRSARRLRPLTGLTPFWERAFHDHGVRDGQDLRAMARYLVANPLRAGLAERMEEYSLWDAAWL